VEECRLMSSTTSDTD